MDWKGVGNWIKDNAGTGAALIGSLMAGNVPGAVALGVSLVSSATGTADPQAALQALQSDPSTLLRLQELANENEQSIRLHIEAMTKLEFEDRQAEHKETQTTIRAGDVADDKFVRWTRPGQSWLSLFSAIAYTFLKDNPSVEIVLLLLALPWGYAGLRQIGKGIDTVRSTMAKKA